ncbi:Gfo/Idh/MocA family protein [Kiritimatiella glycovorans]|uniref:Oxidoreductase YceM n=1 Tax=Kiritimatiella glycovorans TaxID=1307763 RepID=A0A0G3EKW5_9BACT|nr:Gfo/Idh/MocA family oxidoreductase [Kiritimatiella glycovorans]AKJ65400.1 Putative oxidoreductase YceM [Kiritimatiella glycovorans]
MDKVRVGVIGVGSLGRHHARIYSEMDEAELVGICDADRERAAAMAEKLGTQVLDGVDGLAEACDAVSVAVPTDLHRQVAGRLIEQGCHVLVEKPIAASTSEARELVRLSQQHGVMLQVGHIERFNPVLGYLEQQLAETPPRFIEAHRLAPYPPAREGAVPRGTEVSVVLDLMIHDLEVILHLVRSPLSDLRAVGVPVLSPTEDISNARLEFENGCVANVTSSRISPEQMRKIRVFTSDSYISLDYKKQAGEIYRRGEGRIERESVPVEKGDQLTRELRAFTACVAARGRPQVSGEEAYEALKLAVRVIESGQRTEMSRAQTESPDRGRG